MFVVLLMSVIALFVVLKNLPFRYMLNITQSQIASELSVLQSCPLGVNVEARGVSECAETHGAVRYFVHSKV